MHLAVVMDNPPFDAPVIGKYLLATVVLLYYKLHMALLSAPVLTLTLPLILTQAWVSVVGWKNPLDVAVLIPRTDFAIVMDNPPSSAAVFWQSFNHLRPSIPFALDTYLHHRLRLRCRCRQP